MADQKINIIFTGDVTQLNKVVQSAVAELANFESKLKESLGVEGFAAINQQVEQLKNKFKSLSTIDIKANPQQALTAINEVFTGISKLKSSEVFLKANNKEALAAITQLENFASSIKATIDIGFDSSAVTAKIEDLKTKLTGLEANVSIQVSGLDKLNAEILEVKTEINSLTNKKIFIDTDTAKAQDQIKILEAQLLRLERISVSPDITIEAKGRVDTLAADIQKRLSVLRAEVEITTDSAELDKTISNLKGKLSSLEAQVQIESTGLEQVNADLLKTKALLNTFEEVKLTIDSGDIVNEINRIEKEILDLQALKVSPDITSTQLQLFEQNIEQLQTKLTELKGFKVEIPIKPELDPAGFDAEIKKLGALITPFSKKVEIDLNTRVAEAEIRTLLEKVRSLKGQDILINLDGTQVVKTIDAIERELLQLQSKLKTATDPREIAKLNQSLLTLRNSISGVGTNQFTSNLNRAQQATFAFSQVLREAPAFAFSLQTGLLGISNNLPILADRFKEARASGLSTGKIFAEMAKGLVSLPGLMTIASTAAIFIAGAFNKAGKGAEDAAVKIRSFGEIVADSTAGVQGDIAQVNALVRAFKETEGSFEKQNRIIKELKSTNEAYFGDLKAGKTTYEEIAAAANKYTEALVAQAVVKGFSDEISKVSSELAKQRGILKPLAVASEAYNRELAKVAPEARRVGKSNLAFAKQLEVVEGLQAEFNRLTLEMRGAVDESLKFKLFGDKPDPLPKDVTDDIIARAKLFVKQFGETFVVPDLDESFTNTKDKILKSAKQLFDDLAKGKLKIRIPVQVITEADLITENLGEPIPQAQIDKLQSAYFEQLKKEFQEPFILDTSIELAIDNEKIKKQFSDAIKNADFQGALAAIDLDPQVLGIQGLNESLQQSALLINDTLVPAFQNLFDAIIKGEDPLKAFFQSIVQSINQVIQRLIQAAVQALILTAITGGGAGFGKTFLGLIGGLTRGGVANMGGGFIGGTRMAIQVTGSLTGRGSDLVGTFSQGQFLIGRTG